MRRALAIGNSQQIVARWVKAQHVQQRHHPGHEAFAAGFISITIFRLDDHRMHSGAYGKQCGRKSHGSAADDRYPGTGHVRLSSALFSVGIRKPRRKMALRTVNTMAVIQAV